MEKTVVILQDNESFIKSVAALFEGDGTYRVAGFAADGVTGMELIRKCDPDYVILDILLPGMDGLAVLERIREEGLRTKPILLTSVIRDDIAERAIDLGARYILLKPFRFDILLTRMQQLSGGDPGAPVRRDQRAGRRAGGENFPHHDHGGLFPQDQGISLFAGGNPPGHHAARSDGKRDGKAVSHHQRAVRFDGDAR